MNNLRNPTKHAGLVAILDALGASVFDDDEIDRFLSARQRATDLLDGKVDAMDGAGKVDKEQVKVFTFNDTVLITLRAHQSQVSDREVSAFLALVRRFFIDSLEAGVLFRGAVSIGDFVADDDSNTVLGPAVTDAAAWYDKADWIGLMTTPKMTLDLRRREEGSNTQFACIDYDVPLRNGHSVNVKACNWTTLFAVNSVKAYLGGKTARQWFLRRLSEHKVPAGTETKYFNSVRFFDECRDEENQATGMLRKKPRIKLSK